MTSAAVVPEQTSALPRDGLAAHDARALLDRGGEGRLGVTSEDVLAQRQHLLHRAVGLLHELDDATGREADQPVHHLVERQVAPDGKVMIEGQRDDGIGPHAPGKAGAILLATALAIGREACRERVWQYV